MKTGFEDLIYSVTMRCYCSCGAACHVNSNLQGALDMVAAFWSGHDEEGHGATTPQKANQKRKREEFKEYQKITKRQA